MESGTIDIMAYAKEHNISIFEVIRIKNLKLGFIAEQLSFENMAEVYKSTKSAKEKRDLVEFYFNKLLSVSNATDAATAFRNAPIKAVQHECLITWAGLTVTVLDCLDFYENNKKTAIGLSALVAVKLSRLIVTQLDHIAFLGTIDSSVDIWLDVYKKAIKLNLDEESRNRLFNLACDQPEAMKLALKHLF